MPIEVQILTEGRVDAAAVDRPIGEPTEVGRAGGDVQFVAIGDGPPGDGWP